MIALLLLFLKNRAPFKPHKYKAMEKILPIPAISKTRMKKKVTRPKKMLKMAQSVNALMVLRVEQWLMGNASALAKWSWVSMTHQSAKRWGKVQNMFSITIAVLQIGKLPVRMISKW